MSARASDSIAKPAARQPQISYLDISGQRLRVAVWPGQTGRVPLLLLNGIGARLEVFAPFAAAFDELEIIAFDVPGTGGSTPPRFPYRLWMLANVVSRMLDALGYDRVDVMGVSWGGMLAQQFALQNPSRCRRLILAVTSPGVLMVPGRLSVLMRMATPRRYNDAAFRSATMGTLYGGKMRQSNVHLRESVASQMQPTSKRGYLFQQLALAGWSSLPWLPLVRQRTLVMAGDDDPLVPLINAKLMARLLLRAELQVFHDGHMLIFTSQAQAVAAVRGFLDATG